ncbi:hypothetical protein [Ruegeria sp. HKCCD7221]|uniref:hypothetical protein n=1 Tax=Ruegeria sp. HKCCD7221 TaxID=2683009 RepID=UPI00147AFB6F|nr:hypothetical protein [Ruegeria sp. HKCCD7221]
MAPLRRKNGVLVGRNIDETAFDLQVPVQGTVHPGLVQLGRSEGLNPARFWPYYIDPTETTP